MFVVNFCESDNSKWLRLNPSELASEPLLFAKIAKHKCMRAYRPMSPYIHLRVKTEFPCLRALLCLSFTSCSFETHKRCCKWIKQEMMQETSKQCDALYR